jgi:hypothetical protein
MNPGEFYLPLPRGAPNPAHVVGSGAASRATGEGLRGGYASAKQNFQPHKTKNYCGYRSWNYH